MKPRIPSLLLAASLLLPAAATLSAADQVTLRVVTVKTDNPDGYVAEIAKGQAILKRMGSAAHVRVWRARFAGDRTGTIVVAVEFPSLAAMAKDDAMTSTNAEYQSWLKGLDRIRTITSDSLYDELTP